MSVVLELLRAGMIGCVRGVSFLVLVALLTTLIFEQTAMGLSLLSAMLAYHFASLVAHKLDAEETDDE